MNKLLLFLLLIGFYMTMQALQTDEELAMHTVFNAKHALNYSTHAAAQQVDADKLAQGVVAIDPARAKETADRYLQTNLRLDSANIPLPGTFLRSPVNVLVFDVINEDKTFPYVYSNPTYDYSVRFDRPGVVMIIQLEFPRSFQVLGPVTWQIKSSSELVF
ncbi:hypothetical protein [Paenibacillus sp. J2TS4]|uniref:hypothetical protein n=1 Tax=Paenibacillus sp. J2TS4 TaxID=2807194 RepID=UPI001B0A1D95|nr:hypothetical protein [Paenibacillus sp. J2TS4]GIP35441.1 hypothetical protein J2TS4_46510 [Paenibacillus sp. J2TS4]